MDLHRSAPGSTSRSLRFFGLVAAYGFVLVTGTALMMAALANHRDGSAIGPDGQRVTAADLVMQRSAERGMQSPESLLMAYKALPNDKRGF